MTIYVLNKFQPNPYPGAIEIDTTSHGQFKEDLSPFYLGPYEWEHPQFGHMRCEKFENLWQYSKVYPAHAEPFTNNPTAKFYEWQKAGFAKYRADRYPMGKGVKPLYSLWNGQRYTYVEARRVIYIPIYASLVSKTNTYKELKKLVSLGGDVVLRDFDGYDYIGMGRTLDEVIDDPKKKMGHGFVLALLLTTEFGG